MIFDKEIFFSNNQKIIVIFLFNDKESNYI